MYPEINVCERVWTLQLTFVNVCEHVCEHVWWFSAQPVAPDGGQRKRPVELHPQY